MVRDAKFSLYFLSAKLLDVKAFADLSKICNLVVSNLYAVQCLRIGEDWMWVTEDRISLHVELWLSETRSSR